EGVAELPADLVEPGGGAGDADDLGARFGQRGRDRAAESAARPGHARGAAGKVAGVGLVGPVHFRTRFLLGSAGATAAWLDIYWFRYGASTEFIAARPMNFTAPESL